MFEYVWSTSFSVQFLKHLKKYTTGKEMGEKKNWRDYGKYFLKMLLGSISWFDDELSTFNKWLVI